MSWFKIKIEPKITDKKTYAGEGCPGLMALNKKLSKMGVKFL